MLRPSALTTPVVTVPDRPNGLPIATTPSPTFTFEESANVSGWSLLDDTDTRITAMSLDASAPTTRAEALLPSANCTWIEPPPETTWSLVTMSPRLSTTNPDPSAFEGPFVTVMSTTPARARR